MHSATNMIPRKRGRENNATQSQAIPSPFYRQRIDLSHLPTQPRNAVVYTGLGPSFVQQQQNHYVLSPFQQHISNQIKHQAQEIDQVLQAQFHQMRSMLVEKSERHYCTLINTAEESMVKKMREKDTELQNAYQRYSELQARAARFSTEAQVWQVRAKDQEVTVATLKAKLQNAIKTTPEDAESVYIDPELVEALSGPRCKACQERAASVVVVPCMHLSVCVECDRVVSSCPLCLSSKTSSIEVSSG